MNTGKTSTQGMPDWLPELALGKGYPISCAAALWSGRSGFAGPSGSAFFCPHNQKPHDRDSNG